MLLILLVLMLLILLLLFLPLLPSELRPIMTSIGRPEASNTGQTWRTKLGTAA